MTSKRVQTLLDYYLYFQTNARKKRTEHAYPPSSLKK